MKVENIIAIGLVGVLVYQIAKPATPVPIPAPLPQGGGDQGKLLDAIGRGAEAIGKGIAGLFSGRQRKTARCRRYGAIQMGESEINRASDPEGWSESFEGHYDACMDNPAIAAGIV